MTLTYRKWIAVPLLVSGVLGCQNNTQNSALAGAAGGAAAGIGSVSQARAGEVPLVGAAVGGTGGAPLVGNHMETKEREARYASNTYESRAYRGEYATVALRDVVDWSSRGVRDDIIIDRIERSGSTFKLTAADENQLRDQGVSEPVIQAMRATTRRY